MCGATKLRQRRPLPIAHVFAYVALLAWAATFVGLIRSLVSSLIPALPLRECPPGDRLAQVATELALQALTSKPSNSRLEVSMTYPDPDPIRNPDDPWNRQWGSGSVITSIVVIVILAGIIAYGATKTASTGTSSTISQPSTTGQAR